MSPDEWRARAEHETARLNTSQQIDQLCGGCLDRYWQSLLHERRDIVDRCIWEHQSRFAQPLKGTSND